MPNFLHCGEMHYNVCSLTDKVCKRCHAHKYVLTVYLLYANWLHHLKLMDLTWLLNSLCPPIRMYLCFPLDVFKSCVYVSQSLTSSGFLFKNMLCETQKEGNFRDLRHKFRTCLFLLHSLAIIAPRPREIFNPMHRFFRCIFMQVHCILHRHSANPRTLLFIFRWKWRLGHEKQIRTGGGNGK